MTVRDDELPNWLSEQLRRAADERHDPSLREDEPVEVLPGDVCIVRPVTPYTATGRLYVVSDVGNGWCEGMLAGVETELATEIDARLDPASAGVGYEIAVHTRFSGPVWITQISRRVGAVDEHILDQLLALAWIDEPDGIDLNLGVPLQPVGVDPRYKALERMSIELDQLTAECRTGRGELAAPVLDPAIAQPGVLRTIVREPFSPSVVAAANAPDAFVDGLLDSLAQLGPDEQRALQPLIERALGAYAPTVTKPEGAAIIGHRQGWALADAIACAARCGPVVTVVSHRRCWTSIPRPHIRTSSTLVTITSLNDTELEEAA